MANLKLSPTMQKKLDEMVSAPFADYKNVKENEYDRIYFYKEDGFQYAPYHGRLENGNIRTEMDTKTLKALEKRGLIEVVEIGGTSSDTVKLLQHENKSKSLLETRNFVKVHLYLNSGKRIYKTDHTHFIENGNHELLNQYWGGTLRHPVEKVVNTETGEIIFEA